MNKILLFIKKNYLWIIMILCLIITLLIAEDVFEKEIMRCDTVAYKFFVTFIRNDVLTSIMKVITKLGSAKVLLFLGFLSAIFIKNKRIPVCIMSNLILITILNQLLKFIVQRPRPEGYRLIEENGYSFPSGHSMISMAFYGISRIYLGVHYASDVIAGALLSIAYLIIYVKVIKSYIEKKEQ